MARCLRCGADSSWLEGDVPPDSDSVVRERNALRREAARLTRERDEARGILKAVEAELDSILRAFDEPDDPTDTDTLVGMASDYKHALTQLAAIEKIERDLASARTALAEARGELTEAIADLRNVVRQKDEDIGALRKVLAHTAHNPGAGAGLLAGLLASCARIAKARIDALVGEGGA